MSGDIDETRAVTELSAVLSKLFGPNTSMPGYSFALWIVPQDGKGYAPLVSNTPRERLAAVVAQWMIDHNFATATPVPPAGSTPTH